jgi:Fe-coproporphyrin III synthase
MNILKMAASYLNPVQPSYLILFVTSRCNANCGFCFYRQEVSCPDRKSNELTTQEFEMISRKCGNIPYLLLSGGEPVLRDDLFDIISFFVDNAHSQFITVPSNGLAPERSRELFSSLTEKYPNCHFRAAFSIDFDSSVHDVSRGVDGCLLSVLKATDSISELKKKRKNLTMDIVSVYLGSNEQDHTRMRQWVKSRIAPDNHELHLLRPQWPAVTVPGIDTSPFLEEIARYRDESIGRENRKFSAFFRGLNRLYISGLRKVMDGKVLSECTAGRKFAVISETGSVRLCECREDVLGDLRENDYSLKKVLARSKPFIEYVNDNGCTCTWECAVSCNIVCDPRFLPLLFKETASQIFKTSGRA